MQATQEIIINVPSIEPRLKHQTIFQTFQNLSAGESMVIHNDHDPKPVYYQLQNMYGDVFSWEYLQQGPEWWDIRVTKKSVNDDSQQVSNALSKTTDGDIFINIPMLEPRLKHATIFMVFDHIQPGERMVIHNDHDPKPVYYQLLGERGDIFSWEYLEQGPKWWDILVTKNESKATEEPTIAAFEGEVVLNIPELEPKLKHPTIFKTFENTDEGKSFIIHNDHDPKPVFYQLLNEYGDIFTWEYLQQGPQWWDIRVAKKGTETAETIGEITAKDWRKAEVFKKYGIDFCCGGKKTVRQACAEKGIDAAKVEQELQQVAKNTAKGGYTNYDEWSIGFLTDYIINTHHNYVRKYLPEISQYSAKVAKVHGQSHPELIKMNEIFEKVNQELSEHLVEEEKQLFPVAKKVAFAIENNTAYEKGSEDFAILVDKMEQEHDSVGRAMEAIRELSKDYALPEDACASYTLLFKMLDEFESDLFTHIHLENNILFPKVIEAEKTLS